MFYNVLSCFLCGSIKCGTGIIVGVENAGVENAGANCRGGKCRSKPHG